MLSADMDDSGGLGTQNAHRNLHFEPRRPADDIELGTPLMLVIPPAIFSAVGCDVALTLLISTGGGRKKEGRSEQKEGDPEFSEQKKSAPLYTTCTEEEEDKRWGLHRQHVFLPVIHLSPRFIAQRVSSVRRCLTQQWRARTLLTGRRKWNPSPARLALHRLVPTRNQTSRATTPFDVFFFLKVTFFVSLWVVSFSCHRLPPDTRS
ncbi:hypothetical protein MUK42_34975 [Musa troglodytarum]|uniref:Uncharacterized protein n=1 Tax=Musa troglodytarum TaxID=320322 RepID=A0A9E7EFZ5_9LILI|nr:hypothetical protein MUK42_34975 [Musa troglodytarum]